MNSESEYSPVHDRMRTHSEEPAPAERIKVPFRIPLWLGACVFLAFVAFFLFKEHRAHMFGVLPYLIFLACPLMHLFMHHGHGDGRHSGSRH